MSESLPSEPSTDSAVVPFDGGCLGIMFLLVIMMAVFCAITAFDSALVASLSDSQSRRNIFAAIAPLRVGSINIGALLLSGGLGWEALRFARRFAADKAVWIEVDTIRFHPTIRRRSLPLDQLDSITHKKDHASSSLWLQTKAGKRIKIGMVDHDAADAFVAEAERAKAALTFA